jgi:hypothetical protein
MFCVDPWIAIGSFTLSIHPYKLQTMEFNVYTIDRQNIEEWSIWIGANFHNEIKP